MQIAIIVLSVIGLAISIYASYVERRHFKEKNYKALCDINKNISCTKAFSSKYGKIFKVSNTIIGILFYLLVITFSYSNLITYTFYISIPALISSIYLAYISYIKMKNFCLVCTAIYIINTLIFILSYQAVN